MSVPSTKIEGDIRGERVVFGGLMNGTIDSASLSIIKEGVVAGRIATDRGLSIEQGARVSAEITMKKKRKSKENSAHPYMRQGRRRRIYAARRSPRDENGRPEKKDGRSVF